MGVRLAGQLLRAIGRMAVEVGRSCSPWQWGTLATGRGRLGSRGRGSCYGGGDHIWYKTLFPDLDSSKRTCGMGESMSSEVLPPSLPCTDIHIC